MNALATYGTGVILAAHVPLLITAPGLLFVGLGAALRARHR